jgi:competence protein ComEC
VLKVAHHGGAHSTTDPFLAAFRPRVALISVGPNPWNHPTEETLARLARHGVEVFRTDRQGSLRVLVSEDGVQVVAGVVAIAPGALAPPSGLPADAPAPVPPLPIDATDVGRDRREVR